MITTDNAYQSAIDILHEKIGKDLYALLERCPECEELRLRADQPVSMTVGSENILPGIFLSESDLRNILFDLCDRSVHAHEETLCRGYINPGGCVRIAVSGQAITHADTVTAIGKIYCISIRLPHSPKISADPLTEKLAATNFSQGILIYAPPGVGKTTQLRISAAAVSSAPHLRRTVLLDTRGELFDPVLMHNTLIDRLEGYPRGIGLEIAMRTLAPQIVFCDEIGDEAEAHAILAMQNTGVPLVASAHAASPHELLARPHIRMLLEAGVFAECGRLTRHDNEFQIEWRHSTVHGTERLLC